MLLTYIKYYSNILITGYLYFFLFFLFTLPVSGQYKIIPEPVNTEKVSGMKDFKLSPETIIIADEKVKKAADFLNTCITSSLNFTLPVVYKEIGKTPCIRLKRIFTDNLPEEGYILSIDSGRIEIKGKYDGIFNGIRTLFQLIELSTKYYAKEKAVFLECINITDFPKFGWRGMHLDVCRHFFQKDFIKKYIDFLSYYKMNFFHWHLTDDQGWRIEIKKYPKLTEIGAWRNGTLIGHYRDMPHRFDTIRYGGFYTQDDIKEIIKYASERNITVIPEIEMPGHCLAALASYPEFSCTKGKFETAKLWGVFEDVFCTKDETFEFLENILSEVAELFPSPYIHIGGDEVPKIRWKECANCSETMKREKLKDENELQSYFIRRIEKFLNSKGKTIIGWDEILEGGIAPNAIVMSWRGMQGGIEAVKQKHRVIMTPGSHCYFDHYQGNPLSEPLAIGGYTPLEKVYSFNPIPDTLLAEERVFILGAQANLWTEYIPTEKGVEYMVFPRITALSVVLWSEKKSDYNLFVDKVISHFGILKKKGINYSRAIFDLKTELSPSYDKNGIIISMSVPVKDTEIRFSTDGSEPDNNSNLYSHPLEIKEPTIIKASSFYNGEKQYSFNQKYIINKATGKNITLIKEPDKRYNTGGAFALVDGVVGKIPWYGREWLGFKGENLEAIIDLDKVFEINEISVGFLDDEGSWIYLPSNIEIFISDDGDNFKRIGEADNNEIKKQNRFVKFAIKDIKTRYIKIKAVNYGIIPEGKPGEGNPSWLFSDEIIIN